MTKRRLARLLLITAAALAATLLHTRAHAQAKSSAQAESSAHAEWPVNAESPVTAPTRADVARKIDEFGHAAGCDYGARIDNFAIELQNNADAVGYVIAYGPGGEARGSGPSRLKMTNNYLVESRGVEPDRVKTIYGGPYKERDVTYIELWLVPFGATPPAPAKYENDADRFKGKFAEYQSWDGLDTSEITGPPVGDMILAGFAEGLKLQPKTIGYVAAYNGEDAAPGAWRRVAGREAESIEKEYGIEASRVKVIFAGYSKETKIQLWVAAADAPPPVKERKRERRIKEAVQIGRFDEFNLRYDTDAGFVFKGFAEVLKADERLTACVVIRPAPATARDEDPAYAIGPDVIPPPVDLVQLAEKWKARLKKEYGIGEHRLVIMVAPPAEAWALGEVETWVVPPGAALPDLSDTGVIDASEQEEGNPSRSF
jgi:hypothetical protein